MIYILCLIASLNIVLLIETVLWHVREQEIEGKTIGYGRTFIFYLAEVIVIALVIYAALVYFNLK